MQRTAPLIYNSILLKLYDDAVQVSSPNKNSKFKRSRPTQVYFWTNSDVSKWFKRHCADIQMHYNHCFIDHDITGIVSDL